MHEISFDPITHTYTVNGETKISVTEALSVVQDFSRIPPHSLERARIRGGEVHRLTELFDTWDLLTFDDELEPYLIGWMNFREDTKVEIHEIEEVVYSAKYDYAGTLDRIVSFPHDELNSVLDVKATAAMTPVTGLQLAAYRQAYGEANGGDSGLLGRCAVQLGPNLPRNYKLERYDDEGDLHRFLACLNVTKMRRLYNDG